MPPAAPGKERAGDKHILILSAAPSRLWHSKESDGGCGSFLGAFRWGFRKGCVCAVRLKMTTTRAGAAVTLWSSRDSPAPPGQGSGCGQDGCGEKVNNWAFMQTRVSFFSSLT